MVWWRKIRLQCTWAPLSIIHAFVFLNSILYIVFAFVYVHCICEEDRLLAQNKAAVHMGPSLHYPWEEIKLFSCCHLRGELDDYNFKAAMMEEIMEACMQTKI